MIDAAQTAHIFGRAEYFRLREMGRCKYDRRNNGFASRRRRYCVNIGGRVIVESDTPGDISAALLADMRDGFASCRL